MNFLKGYRTLIFNLATSVAALAEFYDVINVVSPQNAPLVLLAVTIANVVLRYFTTTPVAEKV
jgi:hypothetical protein